jgi:hypothetical protein
MVKALKWWKNLFLKAAIVVVFSLQSVIVDSRLNSFKNFKMDGCNCLINVIMVSPDCL